jgi:hypothetical protein
VSTQPVETRRASGHSAWRAFALVAALGVFAACLTDARSEPTSRTRSGQPSAASRVDQTSPAPGNAPRLRLSVESTASGSTTVLLRSEPVASINARLAALQLAVRWDVAALVIDSVRAEPSAGFFLVTNREELAQGRQWLSLVRPQGANVAEPLVRFHVRALGPSRCGVVQLTVEVAGDESGKPLSPILEPATTEVCPAPRS